MSTNQERRAEARQRLREQMEAQARREKQLKIGAASVVVLVLLGIVGVVVWNKAEEARAEQYAADWLTCEYGPENPVPEKIDPDSQEDQSDEALEYIDSLNEKIEMAAELKRDVEPPTGDQARRGTAEITMTTGAGEIPMTLDRAQAPCNVASFIHLSEQEYFDDTECHRMTVGEEGTGLSVLQCGDPTGSGLSGPGYTLPDEPPTDLEVDAETGMSVYPRGTVAMAKSQSPNSAGSQFFLVYEDSQLPPDFTVMGRVAEPGLEVLDEIADAGVMSEDQEDPDFEKPAEPVEIESMVVGAQAGLPEE